jgi:hypothetical protein
MTSTQATPLAGIPGWTQEFIGRLKEGWITSAEQVADLAATPQGLAALREHLDITGRQARRLVAAARARAGLGAVAAAKRRTASHKRMRKLPPEETA